MASTTQEAESHFTVFIRLPFPRGDFVDPPTVAWSAAKERDLWNVISRPSKGNDIDWKSLANEFDVSQPFLLQQAALLYESQLSQVRAQMRRVGSVQSATPSPAPESASNSALGTASQPGKHGGSGGSRVPSRLSTRLKDSSTLKSESGSSPGTPQKTRGLGTSRTASSNSTTHIRRGSTSAGRGSSLRSSRSPSREALPSRPAAEKKDGGDKSTHFEPNPEEVEDSDDTSSSDSETEAVVPRRGPGAKRYQRYSSRPSINPVDEDDDDDDSPSFLPFAAPPEMKTKTSTSQDPSATLRITPERPTAPPHHTQERVPSAQSQNQIMSSASSGSSNAAAVNRGQPSQSGNRSRPPGPLSPRRAAELAGLSPRRRATGKDGSDGTPSMGSSFSDLDDTSVTQSALEEALLSNMQQGNTQSRMSSISQALRSKYL